MQQKYKCTCTKITISFYCTKGSSTVTYDLCEHFCQSSCRLHRTIAGNSHCIILEPSLICWQIQYIVIPVYSSWQMPWGIYLQKIGRQTLILFKICFLIAFCLCNRTAGSSPLQMEVIYATTNNPQSCDPSCIYTQQQIGLLVFEVGHLILSFRVDLGSSLPPLQS